MEIYLVLFAMYVLILNVVTSYRLYVDEGYEKWQKWIQTFLIWLLPFIGAVIVSVMLNRTVSSHSTSSGQIPKIVVLFGLFFFVETPKKKIDGYPSSMNDYGDCTGEVDPGCHMGDGGCGGGE